VLAALAAGSAVALATVEIQGWVTTVLQCAAAPFPACGAGSSAWHSIRSRSLLLGVLSGASTLTMTAWALLAWTDLIALLD
jgi:hypothetical protein